MDFDGDGFFAPAPGAVDGKYVCLLTYREVDGVDVLFVVEAGDPSQVIEGDPEDVCLGRSELEELLIDCHDEDDDRFPNAAELCDGFDNDCNNQLEDSERDDDGDGYTECGYFPATGQVLTERDCNDEVTEVAGGYKVGQFQNPGLPEVCGMVPNPYLLGVENLARPLLGLDDDCDGQTYNGNDPENPGSEQDLDADGHAGCALQVLVDPDEDPESREVIAPDCDDANPEVNPSIGDDVHSNVDPVAAATVPACVSDSDLDSSCMESTEDTTVDWAPDVDFDGDGDEDSSSHLALCFGEEPASGNWVNLAELGNTATDCNDSDARLEGLDVDQDGVSTCDGDHFPDLTTADDEPAAYPGAPRLCDGLDNNLDGAVDNLASFDGDQDGSFDAGLCFGAYPSEELDCDDAEASQNQLDVDGDGATSCDGDCNDSDPTLNIADVDGDFTTSCAGDCDDNDSALNASDADSDGVTTCDGDCDDFSTTVFPGAAVVCNGIGNFDDNCDEVIDLNESDLDSDGSTPCAGDCDDTDATLNPDDSDGDGFSSCAGDCNDGDGAVYLGAPTICDSFTDNDCNGQVDLNEADLDGDTYTICTGDCDDDDSALTPVDGDSDGASSCGGDCDDSNALLNLLDADGDGWPTCPSGSVAGDCDDADPAFGPGDSDGDGNSTCGPDGQAGTPDDDCDDNDPELNASDADGDGETSCGTDCDDTDPGISSGGSEGGSPDGYDNNCNGIADEGLVSSEAVAITEIMIDTAAPSTDGQGEYVELLNTASHPVDLRGWDVHVTNDTTTATTTFQFGSELGEQNALRIEVGERVVLARSANSAAYGFDIADFYWEAATFSSDGGEVELEFGSTLIDSVVWGPTGCSSACSPAETNPVYTGDYYWRSGHSMSLSESSIVGSLAVANDSSLNWCEEDASAALGSNDNFGSPGAATSTAGPCGN